jgi:hypothetical protein
VVPEQLVGVMIGKKGARVTEIIKQSGVKNISVDGGNGESTVPSIRYDSLLFKILLLDMYAYVQLTSCFV